MTGVLLDTSCIVSLLDVSQPKHNVCRDVVTSIDEPLITCEAVIAETCYLLRKIPRAVDSVLQNIETGVFVLSFDLAAQTTEVRKTIRRYKDRQVDLADACLISMADDLGVSRILTLDKDFLVYRWGTKNKPFELLLT